MSISPWPQRLWLFTGTIQLGIGIVTMVSPKLFSRAYGMSDESATGEGLFAWRLFAIRQILMGVGTLNGNETVRRGNWIVQVADVSIFAQFLHTGDVGKRTSIPALMTAGLGFTLTSIAHLVGRRNDRTAALAA